MSLLRSEDMGYYTLIMPHESAWVILNEIGALDALEFVDLNAGESVFNRNYAQYIKRCDEIERRVRFIEGEQRRFGIETVDEEDIAVFMRRNGEMLRQREQPPHTYLEELEEELESVERQLIEQIDTHERCLSQFQELKEKRAVLEQTKDYFLSRSDAASHGGSFLFSHLTGIIRKTEIARFKRMVFRASRGNALTEIMEVAEPFADPRTNEQVEKAVFLILYREGETGAIKRRLTRISDSFGGRIFQIPQTAEEYQQLLASNNEEMKNSELVIGLSKQRVHDILQNLATPRHPASPSPICEYRLSVLRDKAIYHYLNMFQFRSKMFYGECWCPISMENEVRRTMAAMEGAYPHLPRGQLKAFDGQGSCPPGKTPPTHFQLNEFTAAFQEIVDTYGTPNYKEANPALFSIFTFPFLFGVMFGDIGHGLIMTAFATYLCFAKDSIGSTSQLRAAVPVRYLLLLMGICATYTGLIYNDFLSIPLNLFGSKWSNNQCHETYPFGMDPEWYESSFNLLFFNSFKMKISVIFGVTQMVIGTLFRGSNTIRFRSAIDFFFEFLPQLIFLLSIFGYMVCMIFVKWTIDWHYNWNDDAPNLITVLMNMFIGFGRLDDQKPLWGDTSGQESLQLFLILLAVFCVPLMLIPKPLILRYQQNQRERQSERYGQMHEAALVPQGREQFAFGEVVIHQVIETIEFVLGAVSNTASYLRLWALSLAHAQLSEVFFDKAIVQTIEMGNPLIVVLGFFVFANITVGVLMCMDAMECFLHALRLHWVEFMNKFYTGEGNKFAPMSFTHVLTGGRMAATGNA